MGVGWYIEEVLVDSPNCRCAVVQRLRSKVSDEMWLPTFGQVYVHVHILGTQMSANGLKFE